MAAQGRSHACAIGSSRATHLVGQHVQDPSRDRCLLAAARSARLPERALSLPGPTRRQRPGLHPCVTLRTYPELAPKAESGPRNRCPRRAPVRVSARPARLARAGLFDLVSHRLPPSFRSTVLSFPLAAAPAPVFCTCCSFRLQWFPPLSGRRSDVLLAEQPSGTTRGKTAAPPGLLCLLPCFAFTTIRCAVGLLAAHLPLLEGKTSALRGERVGPEGSPEHGAGAARNKRSPNI